ncbi:hypothetical protein CCACVL1_16652 [Corchorus capsularis]|uniref:Uncharacterized protein n=1 Tax=Corchorus capsularis TaxID=210143 RepID=A0A1R3HVW2_COCAP|nr:hypothetical protein CCACVL1_16652 [Corchorus capsularis]
MACKTGIGIAEAMQASFPCESQATTAGSETCNSPTKGSQYKDIPPSLLL